MKKFLVCFLALTLALSCALAEPTLTRKGLTLGEGYVYYPQMEGMEDETLQQAVNAALLTASGAEALLNRLALTMQSTAPLQADYASTQAGDVLTIVTKATGPVETTRTTQTWFAASIDLTNGHIITWDELFTDGEAACLALSDMLEWELAPELSAHLRNAQLTPIPEQFTVDASGLTLYYPMEQLTTLSDRPGTVKVAWYQLQEHLRLGQGSLLERLGAQAMLTLDESSVASIRTTVEGGTLPGIPVALGESVQEAVDAYRLLIDPDLYENGRLIQLENGAFRSVYLLTDSLTSSWDSSIIQGIRTDCINLYGLCTGITTQAAWRKALGQPDASVTVDADKAEANRIQLGTSDYYDFNGVQLRLHAGEDGTLSSLFISSK